MWHSAQHLTRVIVILPFIGLANQHSLKVIDPEESTRTMRIKANCIHPVFRTYFIQNES